MDTPELLPSSAHTPRAWPWWVALVLLCSIIVSMNFLEKSGAPAVPDPAATDSPMLKLFARYMMGAKGLSEWAAGHAPNPGGPSPFDDADSIMKPIDEAAPTIVEQLRVVPIAGELIGREAALQRLDMIDVMLQADPSLDAGLREDARSLRAVYADPPTPLEPPQRDALNKRHHWFARLALSFGAPESDPERVALAGEAARAMAGIIVMFFVLVLAGLAGIAFFVLGVVLLGTGRIRPRFTAECAEVGETPAAATNAFLESFVLFMAAFLIASFLAAAGHALTGIDLTLVLMMIAPLVALWPLSRGLDWTQLRKRIGWTSGRGIFVEIGAGIAGYLAGLPIIVVGVAISMVIITLTGTDASHPIVSEVSSGGALIALIFMTTVWAPLVEETFFRGALFTHLRRRWSALPAALLVGFIFAIIHPQGIGGVPVLTALGMNFCLMREWRGSLIAPMIAHALHNGAATAALVVFLM